MENHSDLEVKDLILGGYKIALQHESSLAGDTDWYDILDTVMSTGDINLMKNQLILYYRGR